MIINLAIMNNLYQISKLDASDYNRGFLQLLEQLTTVEPNLITFDQFCEHLKNISSSTYVIRDVSCDKVVATGSILIEKKFIRRLGSVGHIEDVVVHDKYRGLGLGKSIMDQLIEIGKNEKCYKIILDCNKNNVDFYAKSGFKEKEIQMALYFV